MLCIEKNSYMDTLLRGQIDVLRFDISRFPDGEICVNLEDDDKKSLKKVDHVLVVHSLYPDPNERLMELLLMIDSVKRIVIGKISVYVPYFCYARQDRVTPNSTALSARLVCNMIYAAGAFSITTIDLHSDEMLQVSDIDHEVWNFLEQSVSYILVDYITEIYGGDFSNLVIVYPDLGSAQRYTEIVGELLGCSAAVINKKRKDHSTVYAENLLGDVKDKDCIIVDDIIASGGTLCEAAKMLKNHGAKRVSAYITHPVLCGNALKNIEQSVLDTLYVSDTIPLDSDAIKCTKISVLSVVQNLFKDYGDI